MSDDEVFAQRMGEHIGEALESLLSEGAQLPIHGMVLACNGRAIEVRYTRSADGGLSASTGDAGFATGDIPFPSVMLFLDGSGLLAMSCVFHETDGVVGISEWEYKRMPGQEDRP